MKVTASTATPTPPPFNPLTVSITVETLEELHALCLLPQQNLTLARSAVAYAERHKNFPAPQRATVTNLFRAIGTALVASGRRDIPNDTRKVI